MTGRNRRVVEVADAASRDRSRGLPIRRGLGLPTVASLMTSLGTAAVSVAGIALGSELYGDEPPLDLVSPGGDAANLIVVLPGLISSMVLAWRGSSIGLLLWPGAVFYALYIHALYLAAAPPGLLLFAYAALVAVSALSLVGIVASLDVEEIHRRLATSRVRRVGGVLVLIGLAAYAGLAATAFGELSSPAEEAVFRPQWVIDSALGTPPLLVGGILAWLRRPLGFVIAAGLLFVSGLGGVAFAAAATLDSLLSGGSIEWAVVAVHVVISAVSFGLLAWFWRSRG
jgi:hypothetical protein